VKDLRVVENELVPIYEDGEARRLVNAREMHEFLGSERQFADWIKERIEKYGFVEGEDYEVFHKNVKNPRGGRPATEYLLTVDTAKEIAMIENNERGRQVRKYFIECERRAKALTNTDVILRLTRILEAERAKFLALEAKVARDQAKILFADSLIASGASILPGEMAKILRQNGVRTGLKRFFKSLREDGYLLKEPRYWNTPSQKAMEMGLFEIKEHTTNYPDGQIRVSRTLKITGRGEIYFIDKFLGRTRKAADDQLSLPFEMNG
jgi:anti-repressor protein